MSETATVQKDRVISIDYTLRDEHGEMLDSSGESGPLIYLHGHKNVVPGLEKELEGKEVGETVTLSVPPEEGYGAHHEDRVIQVPRSNFDFDAKAGDLVRAQGPDGVNLPLQVVEVGDETVTLDANHPMAGKTLNFEVTVLSVREASEEEISHGHTHEGDDHDHG